jgi:hypothetical protein
MSDEKQYTLADLRAAFARGWKALGGNSWLGAEEARRAYPDAPLRAAVWTGVAEPLRIGRFYDGTNGFTWPAS